MRRGRLSWAAGLVCLVAIGCQSSGPKQPPTDAGLAEARSELARPLPGDLAALYRLRVRSSGGLRLSVLTAAGSGRITISEPFGSAMSLTAWTERSTPEVFDLRERCRFTTDDLSGVLGVGNLPLPQSVLLLGGRLPSLVGDRIEITDDGRLRIVGRSWIGLITVEKDPWRVTEVEDVLDDGSSGWRARLTDHTSSVPGRLRVTGIEGRWAELELVRLEWNRGEVLPPVPDLPLCGGRVAWRHGDLGFGQDG